jgi:hypothetical protein
MLDVQVKISYDLLKISYDLLKISLTPTKKVRVQSATTIK